jgi:NAD(P)H-hydrate epimerase
MRAVDRIAGEDFGLGILQMMENAGRGLAQHVMERLPDSELGVVVLAGTGGNGGGGLCCARHLLNHGVRVSVVLTRPPDQYSGAAGRQWEILARSGVGALPLEDSGRALESAAIVVDALLGYSLRGAPRGAAAELIERCNQVADYVLALDLPSGLDATSGDAPGDSIRADETLTLALPKTGLRRYAGDLFVADIGIPAAVFRQVGLDVPDFFGNRYRIRLSVEEPSAGIA